MSAGHTLVIALGLQLSLRSCQAHAQRHASSRQPWIGLRRACRRSSCKLLPPCRSDPSSAATCRASPGRTAQTRDVSVVERSVISSHAVLGRFSSRGRHCSSGHGLPLHAMAHGRIQRSARSPAQRTARSTTGRFSRNSDGAEPRSTVGCPTDGLAWAALRDWMSQARPSA